MIECKKVIDMKKIIILFLCLFIGTTIVGCTKSKNDTTDNLTTNDTKKGVNYHENNNSHKKIGLVMKTLTNPFFIEMEKGARKAQKELDINLIVKTGAKETSIEQQIAIVQDLINDKVDAIVIAPGSSTDLIPILKKAQDKGIKIVNVDNRLDQKMSQKFGLKDVPFISVNNEEGGYISAKFISDKINKPSEVAILEGIIAADNSKQRVKGAIRAFNENKNVKIVEIETANWKIDEAYDVTKAIFSKHPNLKAIFCANDMMALGALQYIDKNNKKDILIAGYDALDEVKKAIKEGKIQATIDQQAGLQGYKGIKYAFEMVKGKKEPAETMVDVKLVK